MKTSATLRLMGVSALAIFANAVSAQDLAPLRLGYASNTNNGLHVYMTQVAPEIFEARGFDVSIIDMQSNSPNCVAAMLADEVDICAINPATAAFANTEGGALSILATIQGPVAEIYLTDTAAARTGVSPDAPLVDRVKALRGMSFASAGQGTTYYNIVQKMLADAGVDISEIQYRPLIDTMAMKQGLVNEAFDAAFWTAGLFADAAAEGEVVTWISIPGGDLPFAFPIPTVSIVATTEFVNEDPARAALLHEAFVAGVEALKADPDQYSALIKAEFFPDMNNDMWSAAFRLGVEGMMENLSVSKDGWQALLDMQVANNPNHDFSAAAWDQMVIEAARAP